MHYWTRAIVEDVQGGGASENAMNERVEPTINHRRKRWPSAFPVVPYVPKPARQWTSPNHRLGNAASREVTIFRLVSMAANESLEVVWPSDAGPVAVEDQPRHAGRRLNLDFQDVRLWREKHA